MLLFFLSQSYLVVLAFSSVPRSYLGNQQIVNTRRNPRTDNNEVNSN